MIRRKIEEDQDNPDRWLVSYADFITLLFAFFVVMYSISSVNQKKYKELSSSINTAFISEGQVAPNNNQKKSPKQDSKQQSQNTNISTNKSEDATKSSENNLEALQRERATMTALGVNLSNQLAPLINDGKIRVAQNNRGIRIDINDNLLFTPGSANMAKDADEVLGNIAKLLLPNSRAIQVEGHTDNTPIHSSMFYSNWELSAVRASTVVRKFIDLGVGDFRLSAMGFGSTHPITDNDSAESRAKNRRVSIIILYESQNIKNEAGTAILPEQTKQKVTSN